VAVPRRPGAGCCGTRGIWRELDCPKPNLLLMQAAIRRKGRLNRCRVLRRYRRSADATSGVRAMPSEGILRR
jgi:hypothetical protein